MRSLSGVTGRANVALEALRHPLEGAFPEANHAGKTGYALGSCLLKTIQLIRH